MQLVGNHSIKLAKIKCLPCEHLEMFLTLLPPGTLCLNPWCLPILPFLGGAMLLRGFPVEESSCQCRRHGLIPGSGRSPGEGNGNQLQHSCLKNPMDRGAWQATVHRVTNSQTQLKQLSTHTWILPRLGQSCSIHTEQPHRSPFF